MFWVLAEAHTGVFNGMHLWTQTKNHISHFGPRSLLSSESTTAQRGVQRRRQRKCYTTDTSTAGGHPPLNGAPSTTTHQKHEKEDPDVDEEEHEGNEVHEDVQEYVGTSFDAEPPMSLQIMRELWMWIEAWIKMRMVMLINSVVLVVFFVQKRCCEHE